MKDFLISWFCEVSDSRRLRMVLACSYKRLRVDCTRLVKPYRRRLCARMKK
jgi:hypothetical protein